MKKEEHYKEGSAIHKNRNGNGEEREGDTMPHIQIDNGHKFISISHFSFFSLLFTIKQNQFATKDTALEEESFYDPKVPEFVYSSGALFALLRSSSSQW